MTPMCKKSSYRRYYDPNVQKVIVQAVRWAYREQVQPFVTDHTQALADISK